MEIRITGLEQVQQRLREAPRKLVQAAYEKALDRAIGIVAAEVEARTPEGEEGLLRESVTTTVEIDPELRGGAAKVGFSKSVSSRTGVPQDLIAFLVEYGHDQVTHGSKATGGKRIVGHVPAHPFMRPAAEAAADRAIEVFGDTLIDSLSEIGEGE